MPRKWKIFFADGTTFDSDQGSPAEAPPKPVAVILTEDGRCGRRVLKLMDWYRWSEQDDRWYDCEAFDVLFALAEHGTVTARRGVYMLEAEFEKILISAHNDAFVPRVRPVEPPHPAWRS